LYHFSSLPWNELSPRQWVTVRSPQGQSVRILLLDDIEGQFVWKASIWGQERLFISRAGLVFDGETLRMTSSDALGLTFDVFPAPERALGVTGKRIYPVPVGKFSRYTLSAVEKTIHLAYRLIKAAAPARVVPIGPQGVAQAPEEADFTGAETWELRLPPGCLNGVEEVLLKIDYVGDVGRAYLDGSLIADHFYFGRAWEIGLKRFAPDVLAMGLVLKFLP
jgi:beta-galactosidase